MLCAHFFPPSYPRSLFNFKLRMMSEVHSFQMKKSSASPFGPLTAHQHIYQNSTCNGHLHHHQQPSWLPGGSNQSCPVSGSLETETSLVSPLQPSSCLVIPPWLSRLSTRVLVDPPQRWANSSPQALQGFLQVQPAHSCLASLPTVVVQTTWWIAFQLFHNG